MSRSSSRRRNPAAFWIALLVLGFGWIYNRYFVPYPVVKENTRARQPDTQAVGDLQSDVVVRIADGDSLELRQGGRIRLVGVDCPEQGQRGGHEAAAYTREALLGKTIAYRLCAEQPRDQYGRGLGFIYLRQNGQRVLFNSELLRAGYARVYAGKACDIDKKLWNTYYEEARLSKRGLFATLGEVPDASSYRRENRRE